MVRAMVCSFKGLRYSHRIEHTMNISSRLRIQQIYTHLKWLFSRPDIPVLSDRSRYSARSNYSMYPTTVPTRVPQIKSLVHHLMLWG